MRGELGSSGFRASGGLGSSGFGQSIDCGFETFEAAEQLQDADFMYLAELFVNEVAVRLEETSSPQTQLNDLVQRVPG